MRKLRMLTGAALLSGAALLASTSANAVFIFEDDFERGATTNVVGNGWTETENGSADVAVATFPAGNLAARLRDVTSNPTPPGTSHDVDAMIAQLGGIATTGLTNIMLAYDFARANTGAADVLYVEWKLATDVNWIVAAMHAGNTGSTSSLTSNLVALGVNAANVTNLQFRFTSDVSLSDELFWVDNVSLTGDRRIRPTPTGVPEPGTLGLLGFGLTGIGALYRRKKAAKTA